MKRSDYAVVGLIALGLLASSAIETQVPGFALPPAAIFLLSVLAKVIYPLLGVLPQLGVHVPSAGMPEANPQEIANGALSSTPMNH